MKVCSTCKVEKPLEAFSKMARNPDGRQPRCRQCAAEYFQANRDKIVGQITHRKAEIRRENQYHLWTYLANHPCVDCSESDPTVLEFDHLRDKVRSIAHFLRSGYYWKAIEAEIAKCEVVCANCHRRRTYTRAASWRSTMPL